MAITQSTVPDSRGIACIPGSTLDQYTQLVKQLPPSLLVEELISVFFTEANWHVQILDQVLFNAAKDAWLSMLADSPPRRAKASLEQLIFPALLFQTLAVAVLFLPRGTMSEHTLRLWDYSAKSALSEDWSTTGSRIAGFFDHCSPVLTVIEHDLAKALCLKTHGRGLAAWKVLGKAIRYEHGIAN